MKTVCIKDIAKKSGVSITAVSLILNNKATSIPEETIQRVKKVASESGYRPNAIASSLKTKRTKTIGYVMPSIENSFFSEIAKKVEKIVEPSGYSIIICSSDDKFEKDYNLIQMLTSRMIDFLLYCPSSETLKSENLHKIITLLHSIDTPYVVVDRQIKGDIKSKVVCDDHQGGMLATQHLIENGHKKIACITGPLEMSSANNRYLGYEDSLKENNIPFVKDYVFYGNFDFESGYKQAKEALKTDVTAMFVCNDLMAYGALKAIKESGKKVPQDISIVGYDDLMFSELLDTPLTTIHQDIDAIADCIGKYIISVLEERNTEITIKAVPSYLVKRSTVARREEK